MATSRQMDLSNIDQWAKIKGVDILGTGDFTHPKWLSSLKERLEEVEDGIFRLKGSDFGTRFVLTTEVCNVYTKNGKVRKIHNLIFSPSFEVTEKINSQIKLYGDLKANGRPILKLDAEDLVKIVLSVSDKCLIIPAHIWTPWFGVLGFKSGFGSLGECFGDYLKYIYACETGLSSDPSMNRRLSSLDNITLISNSDAHSLQNIGREANVFEGEKLNYESIYQAIKNDSKNDSKENKGLKLVYTIEFYPQEGKYYYDGHRNCRIGLSPQEAMSYNNICPVCGKKLTLGVLNRVEKLSNRPEDFKSKKFIPFKSLIPLRNIISSAINRGVKTLAVAREYKKLIDNFGSEFNVLLNVPLRDLSIVTSPRIAEGIIRVRNGNISIEPGYDGLYGKVKIFS